MLGTQGLYITVQNERTVIAVAKKLKISEKEVLYIALEKGFDHLREAHGVI